MKPHKSPREVLEHMLSGEYKSLFVFALCEKNGEAHMEIQTSNCPTQFLCHASHVLNRMISDQIKINDSNVIPPGAH